MISIFLLLLVSSALLAGAIFRHERILTYLAAMGILAELQILLLGFLHRYLAPYVLPTPFFLSGAVVIMLLSITQWPRFSFRHLLHQKNWLADGIIIIVILIVLSAISLINASNYQQGTVWVTHGFLNGDTLTLVSLIQRSRATVGLLTANPLAANGHLEYPTVLHGAIADILNVAAAPWDWFKMLPLWTLIQTAFTVPLFFLLADIALPRPKQEWQQWLGVPSEIMILVLQGAIILVIMAFSWDSYIYPQSHFFLTALFLLEIILLAVSSQRSGSAQWLPVSLAVLTAALLYVSNAVLGTAALAAFGVACLLRMNTKSAPIPERIIYTALLAGTAAWFLAWTPGESAFGHFHFSYTAALDMAALGPITIAILASAWLNQSRQRFLSACAPAVAALGLLLFFFSARNIVVANASRFFYLAIVVAWPLHIPTIIQLYYFLRRELLSTTHTFMELAAGFVSVLAVTSFLIIIPAGAAVVSAHDNLMRKDMHILEQPEQQALAWIQTNTAPTSLFVASPHAPWWIPYFTGRAIVRASDYWLSPQDLVTTQLAAAFTGNTEAQQAVTQQGDYLFLTAKDRKLWGNDLPAPVFTSTSVSIYNLREIIDPLK